ncbi:MAG: hypothetical protein NT076_01215 [Candidatus Pacearchaeota archaeon]|nr:hypothetical protein [Candidatus Pacearchaeota archaeon]
MSHIFSHVPAEVFLNISGVADNAIQGRKIDYLRGKCRELLELHDGRRKPELFEINYHYWAYACYATGCDPEWAKLRAFVNSPTHDKLTREEMKFLDDLSGYCHAVGISSRRAGEDRGLAFAA